MASAGIELVRAMITEATGGDRLRRAVAESSLAHAILEYTRTHLSEPDLDAARVAGALHISVRQLYATLARENITLRGWIRSQRLEGSRADLARPATGAAPDSITAIARRWGFVDSSHFGRVFKREFGVTPRDWRDLHQHADPR